MHAAGGADDAGASRPLRSGHARAEAEDLPYKVELWDAAKQAVEQVLAVTSSSSIGYAAYYAATKEFPDRYVTFRHKGGVMSRWNAPSN